MTGKLSVPVVNKQGAEVGSVEVDPKDFAKDGKISRQLLHDVVLMYLANQRAGTHSTLRRGQVAGSTKKLFRQKGTGKWTVQNSADLGMPITLIAEAVYSRCVSAIKDERVTEVYPKCVWLNPEPEEIWGYRQSIGVIKELMNGRMFPTTLEGLERAMKLLAK